MKFKLVQDDSGHDYVIPSDKTSEWNKFMAFDAIGYVPDWAERVEGGLEFENPTENGKELFDWIETHGIEIKPPNTDGKMMWHLFKESDKSLIDLQGKFNVPKSNPALDKDQRSTKFLQEIEAWLCFNKQPSRNEIMDLHNDIKKHLGLEK